MLVTIHNLTIVKLMGYRVLCTWQRSEIGVYFYIRTRGPAEGAAPIASCRPYVQPGTSVSAGRINEPWEIGLQVGNCADDVGACGGSWAWRNSLEIHPTPDVSMPHNNSTEYRASHLSYPYSRRAQESELVNTLGLVDHIAADSTVLHAQGWAFDSTAS